MTVRFLPHPHSPFSHFLKMGVFQSRHRQVQQHDGHDKQPEEIRTKIYVLGGTSACGKHVLYQRMVGVNKEEAFLVLLRRDLINRMRALCQIVAESGRQHLINDQSTFSEILKVLLPEQRDKEAIQVHLMSVKKLWTEEEIKNAWKIKSRKTNHYSSYENLFDRLDEIGKQDYSLSDRDALLSYVARPVIVLNECTINNTPVKVVAFSAFNGKQKQRWFSIKEDQDDISAIIYVVDLSAFDLETNKGENYMKQSLLHFSDMLTYPAAQKDSQLFLYLNKIDLFYEKLLHTKIPSEIYQDFSEGQDFISYIQAKFHQRCEGRKLTTFVTCLLDKEKTQEIIDQTMSSIKVL